jgi:hypothetical protein
MIIFVACMFRNMMHLTPHQQLLAIKHILRYHYQGENASIQSGNNFALMMGPFIGDRMMGPYHPITDKRIG